LLGARFVFKKAKIHLFLHVAPKNFSPWNEEKWGANTRSTVNLGRFPHK
jgi:hypothetical protein